MPGLLDWLLVIVFAAAWPLLEVFVLWPRHLRAVDAGTATARTTIYKRTLVEQWMLVAAVLALTLSAQRPLDSLGLHLPEGWRLLVGFALPAVYAWLAVTQARALSGEHARLSRLREKLHPLRALVPHDAGEYRLFAALSVTAGICEELLFRGYLVWVLQASIGLWAAAGVSVIVFGLAHAYQGARFGLRAGLAGVVMGTLALLTGSVIPGMVLHAFVDLGSGYITCMAMQEPVVVETGPTGLRSRDAG